MSSRVSRASRVYPLRSLLARIARFVAPGLPHHVTQRGNRRERIFFADDDYALYLDLLASHAASTGWRAGPIA